jgi:hypothetical protein
MSTTLATTMDQAKTTHRCGSNTESLNNATVRLGRYSIYKDCVGEGSEVFVDAIGQGVISKGKDGESWRFGRRHGNRQSAYSATRSRLFLVGGKANLNGHHRDYDEKTWMQMRQWEHDYVEHDVPTTTESATTMMTSAVSLTAITSEPDSVLRSTSGARELIDSPMMQEEQGMCDTRLPAR